MTRTIDFLILMRVQVTYEGQAHYPDAPYGQSSNNIQNQGHQGYIY